MVLNLIRRNKATSIIGSLIISACVSFACHTMAPILLVTLVCLLSVV